MLTPTIRARLAEATVLECSEETKNALKAAKIFHHENTEIRRANTNTCVYLGLVVNPY